MKNMEISLVELRLDTVQKENLLNSYFFKMLFSFNNLIDCYEFNTNRYTRESMSQFLVPFILFQEGIQISFVWWWLLCLFCFEDYYKYCRNKHTCTLDVQL